MTGPLAQAAASTLARDALWRDPPPLAPGCDHDLELLPVIEPRFTVLCRKCGGLDVEASRGMLPGSPDSLEFIVLEDSTVIRRRPPCAFLAAFCYARLDEDDLEYAPEHALRQAAALRSVVADCEKALRYPANGPLYNLARRTLEGVASIWEDHPGYDPGWTSLRAGRLSPQEHSSSSSPQPGHSAGLCHGAPAWQIRPQRP